MSGSVIFIVGFIASSINKCNIGPQTWNIIMGRFMATLLIFLFIWKSDVPIYFKMTAFTIACYIGFFEICLRQHHTSDLIITLTFTYLAIGLFDTTKLGLSSSSLTAIAFYTTMTIVLIFFVFDIYFNCNIQVTQRHDYIRNIVIELFTVLSISSLILFAIHCGGEGGASSPPFSIPKVFMCSVIYFVCVIVVTFFYFSLVKNANIAFTAIMIILILYLFASINTGLCIFDRKYNSLSKFP